uniref:Protein-serine/threonine phosphatase n=1 Tax=Picocystis salinarum TaxID=88271 RepID=A0A6U9R5F0_9CHLO
MEVEAAMEQVRRLVQLGSFHEAEAVGKNAPIPLAMRKDQLGPVHETTAANEADIDPGVERFISADVGSELPAEPCVNLGKVNHGLTSLSDMQDKHASSVDDTKQHAIQRVEASIPSLNPATNFISPSSRVSFHSYEGANVAIKFPKIASSADLERFRAEIIVLSHLAHPNIVRLVGARCIPPDYFFATQLCSGGSLEGVLHALGYSGHGLDAHTTVGLAQDIASALQHAHMHGIIHRDVKPANILFDGAGRAVLADFGIAEFTHDRAAVEGTEDNGSMKAKQALDIESQCTQDSTDMDSRSNRKRMTSSHQKPSFKPSGGFQHARAGGTMLYMAPEQLMGQHAEKASDVWAWAVMINEAMSGIKPYSDCNKGEPDAHTVLELGYAQHELSSAIVSCGLRPTIATGTPAGLGRLLEQCWEKEPSKRPSFQNILPVLESVSESLPAKVECPHAVADSSKIPEQTMEPQKKPRTSLDLDKELELDNGENIHWPRPPHESSLPSGSYFPTGVKVGSFETAGNRGEDRMEDRHVLAECLGGHDDIHMVAIFDGHRGSEMAEFAQRHMLQTLRHYWHLPLDEALRHSFLFLDAKFRALEDEWYQRRMQQLGPENAGKRSWPGATAICALLVGRHLWVANTGDCRAVLCQSGLANSLTRDHTVEDASERERVKLDGGLVEWKVNSWRVGKVGIQVTRSLGDGDLKNEGVIADPEITYKEITNEDEFLILASDGLWERVPNQAAVGLVHDTVKQPNMCSQRLAFEAITAGSGDNVTVAVMFLQPADTIEKVYALGREKYAYTDTAFGTRSARAKSPTRAAADEILDTY